MKLKRYDLIKLSFDVFLPKAKEIYVAVDTGATDGSTTADVATVGVVAVTTFLW